MNADQRILLRAELAAKFSLENILEKVIKSREGTAAFLFDQPKYNGFLAKSKTELEALRVAQNDLKNYDGENPVTVLLELIESLNEGVMTDAGLSKDDKEKMAVQIAVLDKVCKHCGIIEDVLDAISTTKLPRKGKA